MKPRALIAWSSGKDSAWALHRVRLAGEMEVVGALTTITENFGRVSMHGVRQEILEAQCAAANLPLYPVTIPFPCPNEIYEQRMADAMRAAREQGIARIVFGDLFLEDIRAYREAKLRGSGIEPVFPLWKIPTEALAREMIAGGLKARVESLLAALPAGVDPCAENGEFHTCVTGGPMFEKNLNVTAGEVVERDGFVFTDLKLA
jgi:diphthamide synthase (EF-2-diphthine--ammonia ligase)